MDTSTRSALRTLAVGAACLGASHTLQAEGLLGVHNPAAGADSRAVFIQSEHFVANDALPMAQYLGDWQGNYQPRDAHLGLLSSRSALGLQWGSWQVASVHRADVHIEATRDTTDLVRQFKTDGAYDTGRRYGIDFQLQGFEATGLRLGKQFSEAIAGWQMQWGVSLSALQGTRVKEDKIQGQATAFARSNFIAQVNQSLADSGEDTSGAGRFNPPLGERPAWKGEGYSVDLGWQVQRDDGLSFAIAINDLLGVMEWKDLPSYNATFTNSMPSDGLPSASAQSSYASWTQILAPRAWMAVRYPIAAWELQFASSFTRDHAFPELGLSYQLSPDSQLQASYDLRFQTLGLRYKHPWGEVGLRADTLDFTQAKAYGLHGRLHIPL